MACSVHKHRTLMLGTVSIVVKGFRIKPVIGHRQQVRLYLQFFPIGRDAVTQIGPAKGFYAFDGGGHPLPYGREERIAEIAFMRQGGDIHRGQGAQQGGQGCHQLFPRYVVDQNQGMVQSFLLVFALLQVLFVFGNHGRIERRKHTGLKPVLAAMSFIFIPLSLRKLILS